MRGPRSRTDCQFAVDGPSLFEIGLPLETLQRVLIQDHEASGVQDPNGLLTDEIASRSRRRGQVEVNAQTHLRKLTHWLHPDRVDREVGRRPVPVAVSVVGERRRGRVDQARELLEATADEAAHWGPVRLSPKLRRLLTDGMSLRGVARELGGSAATVTAEVERMGLEKA